MTIERATATVPASGVVQLPRGNFFVLFTASAAVNIRIQQGGTSEGFNGITGGVRAERIKPWEFIEIFGTAGTTIEYYYGSIEVAENKTDLFLATTTISGTASVEETPTATVVDRAPITIATANASTIATNSNRRKMRIYAASTNNGSCFLRPSGSSNNIAELQPGMYHDVDTLAALDIRNDTGSNATFYILEQE